MRFKICLTPQRGIFCELSLMILTDLSPGKRYSNSRKKLQVQLPQSQISSAEEVCLHVWLLIS
ncbi:hypothetical protein WL29_09975 [Burkholderia ubonensis]|uniref:Uncharacterized protein n=1 Tax=Burkholderia ubonensis TaxID=101571 RepID=A0A125DHH0_9BURK|nr:hypothetical protein WJ31_21325 [Burkholderia ubonensis]KWA68607.1 hypothetical protein WL29_09975 [Burkholderia ubonensis]